MRENGVKSARCPFLVEFADETLGIGLSGPLKVVFDEQLDHPTANASAFLQGRWNATFGRHVGTQDHGLETNDPRTEAARTVTGPSQPSSSYHYFVPTVSRNMMLLGVFLSLPSNKSIASTGGTPTKARLKTDTRVNSSG